MLHRLATMTLLIIFGSLGFADAQQPSIKRTPLQKFELPGTNYDGMMGIAEIVRMPILVATAIRAWSPVMCWKAS